jgi:hypothetical protein
VHGAAAYWCRGDGWAALATVGFPANLQVIAETLGDPAGTTEVLIT